MTEKYSSGNIYVCPWDQAEAEETKHTINDDCYYQCSKCGRSFLPAEWPIEAVSLPPKKVGDTIKLQINDNSQAFYRLDKDLFFNMSSDGKLTVESQEKSKCIAKIYKHSNENWLVDLGSPNGIILNPNDNKKEKIHNTKIGWGDTIHFSDEVKFRFTLKGLELVQSDDKEQKICIKVKNISSNVRGKAILKNISLCAKSGEFIGILGPSGCGKSSLIQRIIGLAPIDSDKEPETGIFINEKRLKQCKDQFLSMCAYVPQQTTLHEPLTIEEECYNFAYLNLADVSYVKKAIDYILCLVGLAEERNKQIQVLSGGQKKRLGIALELLREPRVLLLDEPSSGLDPASETKIMNYLRSIANQGKIALCATHTMENVELFDKVLILSQGEEIFFGTPEKAKEHFGVTSFQNIYNSLEEDSDDQKSNDTSYYKNKWEKPENENKRSLDKELKDNTINSKLSDDNEFPNNIRQVIAYLKRSWLYYKHNIPWIVQLLIQPVLIALVIKCACAGKFFGSSMEISETYFFCLMSMFWLGMNNSVRELVSQLIPVRCLERLEQVPLSVYLLSKWVLMFIICVIQTFIFAFVLRCPFMFPPEVETSTQLLFNFSTVPILFSVSIIGYLIGLAVSAFFKSQTTAVAMLPILIIPVILLSEPVTRIESSEPNFTHIFIVAGFALIFEIFIICIGLFIKRPNIQLGSILMLFLISASLYFFLLSYNNQLENPKEKNYTGLAEKFQTLSPCYMPLQLINEKNSLALAVQEKHRMEKEKQRNTDEAEKAGIQSKIDDAKESINKCKESIERIKPYYWLSFLAYAALAITLTIVFQSAREKEWEGR